jgi:hypothetical protein
MDSTTAFGVAAFTAIIAFLGSIVIAVVSVSNHAYSERQKEKIEKRNKRAEKLEEFASALYDHQYWLVQLMNRVLEGERELSALLAKSQLAPFTKLSAIAIVNFPEFLTPIKELSKAAAVYINTLLKLDKKDASQANHLMIKHNEISNHLEALIEEYAKREFQ